MGIQAIDACSVGGFTLSVNGKEFLVTSFQLVKSIGALSTCTVGISDYTQQVAINNSSYPKDLGSIKTLFEQTQKTQNIGTLMDVKLKEYLRNGSVNIWFIGKLCVAAPLLDASYGVSASLSCYCTGKACMLMYSPVADFIYTPSVKASDMRTMQQAGVFDSTISQAKFASSMKADLLDILTSQPKVSSKDTIIQMLDKALKGLLSRKNKKGSILGQAPKIDLLEYFDCDIRLSQAITSMLSQLSNPYVTSLILDFFNGFKSATIYQALVQTIQARDRYLTFIPPSIQEAQKGIDKLKICPSYIEPVQKDFGILLPNYMLSCSINTNPLQHLKTPTCIYIRAAKSTAWQSDKDTAQAWWEQKGMYALPGAKPPLRVKVLDVPGWVLNAMVQRYQQADTAQRKDTKMRNDDDVQPSKKPKQSGQVRTISQKMLDQVAKTKFFHQYMLNKQADLTLAVNRDTILMDKYLGKSIEFFIPVQAQQLINNQGSSFYGRLQQMRYNFKAATSPKAKSILSIKCSLQGVTSKESPASALYTDDGRPPIYKKG